MLGGCPARVGSSPQHVWVCNGTRWRLSRVSKPVKWVPKCGCLRALNSGVQTPEDAPCKAPRSPHMWWRWVQGWWGGGKSHFFWGCEQLGMLKSCSLTPSCPRAGDPGGKIPPLGHLGKKEQGWRSRR